MSHYPDTPPPRPPGWWLPVTRHEFNLRMTRVETTLTDIDRHLMALEETLTVIGERMSEATDLLAQINDATNQVATRLQGLIDELANQSDASPEVLDALRSELSVLQGLAADPNNPVPAPPADGS